MAKCGLCSTKKGKRYCSPLDRVICPICCADSRMKKIECNEDCRYLEGVSFQQKRSEDKEFSELMSRVGHGQYDDIFHHPDVAMMAFEIESLVRYLYIEGEDGSTDTAVFNAYKSVYKTIFQRKEEQSGQIDALTLALLSQYEKECHEWGKQLDEVTMGNVYLRLMTSVKNMSCGRFGEFGYLNYLKNNLGGNVRDDEFVMEDKFGHKITRKLE